MSYYDDDDSIYRVRRYGGPPVRYVEPDMDDRRPRGRDPYRPSRAASPGPPAVIINNRVYNDASDDEDDRHLQLSVVRPPHPRSRSSSYVSRDELELERTQHELQDLRLDSRRAKIEKERQEERERREYEDAKRELDEMKRRDAQRAEEDRVRKELELERLKEAEREAAEKEEREKEIRAAIEKYKVKERERRDQEEKEKEETEKELERRMQKQLLEAGLSETQITAIMNRDKMAVAPVGGRATYTRMARRHLSFETLRLFSLDYDLDPADSEYILIKRWVPEEEQASLWKHTRYIREERRKLLMVEEKKHHHHKHKDRDPEFEWVRKRGSSRKRSKSPGLLMYLAGAR